jgi:hypothetical protein
VTCTAETGWSPRNGKKILPKKVNTRMSCKSEENPYKGIPLARDSVTLLKPPCVRNHPVAYEILSVEPGHVTTGM